MSQQATSGGSSSSSPPVWEGNGEPPEGFLPRNAKASSKQTTHETTGDDNLPMDCVFEWKVKNFEKIVNDRVYSEIQCFGNFKWRLLLFPRGVQVEDISVFLDVADAESLPDGWRRDAEFVITLVNHKDPKKSISKEGVHLFNATSRDRGFTQFTDRQRREVLKSKSGFLLKDALLFTVHVKVLTNSISMGQGAVSIDEEAAASWAYDSRKSTGYIGMSNQGATCYLNSLIQSLYHIPFLRKAVFMIPTQTDIKPSESIPLALQRVFYDLVFSEKKPVSTADLTKSFGWTSEDALTQHDVQEFNRVLQDKLEEKMKHTDAEGTIEKLFRGTTYNYIKCLKVKLESIRKEDFYDISLNVKGCSDIISSLRKYTEPEKMDGDNMYKTESHGLQPAQKGILFDSFPPVLHLHLKRFEYDYVKQQYIKVNDKFIFQPMLNLAEFVSPDADKSGDYIYHLHGVLVHSGTVGSGHYYAFLRPGEGPQWYKFDDTTVVKVSTQRAIDDNFGGAEISLLSGNKVTTQSSKNSSAYMLVYIKSSARRWLLQPLSTEKDIPKHLATRASAEKIESENRDLERLATTKIKFITEDDFRAHTHFDLCDERSVRSIRIRYDAELRDAIPELARVLGIQKERIRLWEWIKRKNKSQRPDELFTEAALSRKIHSWQDEITVFIEESPIASIDDSADSEKLEYFTEITSTQYLIFMKFYDPTTESTRYLGKMVVFDTDKLSVVAKEVINLLKLPENTQISLFEEIRPDWIEHKSHEITFTEAELSTGDILVAQITPTPEVTQSCQFPEAPAYYEFLFNSIIVNFVPLENPSRQPITLRMPKETRYDKVVLQLAQELNWDPEKIRLTGTDAYGRGPARSAISANEYTTLFEMLKGMRYGEIYDKIYYELFDVSVEEIKSRRRVVFSWRDSHMTIQATHELYLPRDGRISDLADKVRSLADTDSKIKFETEAKRVRIVEVFRHRIDAVMQEDQFLSQLSMRDGTGTGVVAEEVPMEELDKTDADQVVQVLHFRRTTFGNLERLGQPFLFVFKEGEKLKESKARLATKLLFKESDLKGLKFCHVDIVDRPHYFSDTDVIASKHFGSRDFFGIEHPIEGSSAMVTASGAGRQQSSRREKAVTITG